MLKKLMLLLSVLANALEAYAATPEGQADIGQALDKLDGTEGDGFNPGEVLKTAMGGRPGRSSPQAQPQSVRSVRIPREDTDTE